MNALTKKLISEIDNLLQMAATFPERYKASKDISGDLLEDLIFFHARIVYIFQAANKTEHNGFIRRFNLHHVQDGKSAYNDFEPDLIKLIAIIRSFKRELEGGYLFKAGELLRNEIFSDFLEMGKYLLDTNWKDAAAVMIGGVLEDKLRILAVQNNIGIIDGKGKKLTIEPLNVELKKANVYELTMQKRVTLYADIRNHAAHAEYDKYKIDEVEDMYKFVEKFVLEY